MRSLLDFAKLSSGEERKEVSRALISTIADKMRVEAILGVVNQEETLDVSNVWDSLFCKKYDMYDWVITDNYYRILLNTLKDSKIEPLPDKPINLSDHPVIAMPWDYVRLKNALGGIGTTQNQWRQIESDHAVTVLLPMDIAVVTSGRHSICAGVQKRKGSLRLYDGMENHWRQIIYDMSKLYGMVEFDGEDYIWVTNEHGRAGDIAAKAANFNFGCIFELGRFLL